MSVPNFQVRARSKRSMMICQKFKNETNSKERTRLNGTCTGREEQIAHVFIFAQIAQRRWCQSENSVNTAVAILHRRIVPPIFRGTPAQLLAVKIRQHCKHLFVLFRNAIINAL